MTKLYYLQGSRHSIEAEKLLINKSLKFEKIDVTASGMLAQLDRELGIRQLPTVFDGESRYEGIAQIKEFVNK